MAIRKVEKKKTASTISVKPLTTKQVYNTCPTSVLPFKSTKEITTTNEIISQKRAVEAINMGLGIRKPGYNIYVAGYQGTGKTSVIRSFLEKWSKNSQTPPDWVYVYNFQQVESPLAIKLNSGRGSLFSKLVDQAIKELRKTIPQALQSEDYENAVNARLSLNNEKQSKCYADLEKLARSMDFQVKSTRLGIETIPVVDGRALTEKEYSKLSDRKRDAIESKRSKLEPQVLEFARQVRSLEIEAKDFVTNLQRKIGQQMLDNAFEPCQKEFALHKEVLEYVREVRNDILENLLDFVDDEAHDDESTIPHIGNQDSKEKFRKYKVNVFVDNKGKKGAPVLIEANPTFYNLFGKVEKNVEHGMFLTDFTVIQPGSIHKANGGYLVVEANDILKMPYVWETLKRVLRTRQGFIEDIGESISMFPTSGFRPEPIPLDIKVIFIGTDEVYHILHDLDEEFSKLFKIKSDFDYKMERNASNIKEYTRFIATRCKKEELLHFDKSGVAAIIEYSSRLVEDQTKLSTQFGEIKDLTIEADYIARQKNSKSVKREHVEEAIDQKLYRVNLYEHHLMEMTENKSIMISVEGESVGQVNGLAVYDLGDHSFGKISRITSTVTASDEGIFNIERASKLSGNIHDKGTYILSSYLNAMLAKMRSIPFSASICFEQSYGQVDGDSATIAELVAVISAMSGIPVKQNLAITGSLNQFGVVQPVGGINEKIEGFYASCELLCKSRKPEFQVIIPMQNVSNLMLTASCQKAVAQKRLKIYPVTHFSQAFKIATGVHLGAKSIEDEVFSKNSALDVIKKKIDAYYSSQSSE